MEDRAPHFVNSAAVGDFVAVSLPDSMEEINIHYLEAGVGEPLLLIHGIGMNLYTWRNVYAGLSEYYRVIAIDLPGHGYSDRPETFAYSMDEMAALIREFLKYKGISCTHMIGFSTGAGYMLRFLTLYPEMAANCIAIAPGGISRNMPSLYHNMEHTITAVFARNLFNAGDVQRILEDAVFDPAFIRDRDVKQYYQPLSDGKAREAMMYAVKNYDMKGTAEELKDVDHEVICVWGKEDDIHPVSGSAYFRKVLKAGRYYVIRNAGHLPQEEQPEQFLDLVLSSIPPAENLTYGGEEVWTQEDYYYAEAEQAAALYGAEDGAQYEAYDEEEPAYAEYGDAAEDETPAAEEPAEDGDAFEERSGEEAFGAPAEGDEPAADDAAPAEDEPAEDGSESVGDEPVEDESAPAEEPAAEEPAEDGIELFEAAAEEPAEDGAPERIPDEPAE